jgi:hypothetical protein
MLSPEPPRTPKTRRVMYAVPRTPDSVSSTARGDASRLSHSAQIRAQPYPSVPKFTTCAVRLVWRLVRLVAFPGRLDLVTPIMPGFGVREEVAEVLWCRQGVRVRLRQAASVNSVSAHEHHVARGGDDGGRRYRRQRAARRRWAAWSCLRSALSRRSSTRYSRIASGWLCFQTSGSRRW